jgi:hypothetical protein
MEELELQLLLILEGVVEEDLLRWVMMEMDQEVVLEEQEQQLVFQDHQLLMEEVVAEVFIMVVVQLFRQLVLEDQEVEEMVNQIQFQATEELILVVEVEEEVVVFQVQLEDLAAQV